MSAQDDAHRWLWCGSAGLAHAIAAHRGLAPEVPPVAFHEATKGPVLLISASHHPVVRQQWDVLKVAESGVDRGGPWAAGIAPGSVSGDGTPIRTGDVRSFPEPVAFARMRLRRGWPGSSTRSSANRRILRRWSSSAATRLRALCRAAGVHTLMAGMPRRAPVGAVRASSAASGTASPAIRDRAPSAIPMTFQRWCALSSGAPANQKEH